MQKVWRALGIRHHIVEQISSLRQDVAMIQATVVPGKHSMEDLMITLKEA